MEEDVCARIQEHGRRQWRNGFGIHEREQQYIHLKSQQKNDKYANESKSEINGQRRVHASKSFYRNGNMMIYVCVGQRKLIYVCFLSVKAMTW